VKLTHFKYCFKKTGDSTFYKFDLHQVLKAFFEVNKAAWKIPLIHGTGEHLYLFPTGKRVWLLLMTKKQDIIKAINSKTASYQDIADKLENDEDVSFSSYIYVGDVYFSIACTLGGPRYKAFFAAVSEIIKQGGINDYEFIHLPFGNTVDRTNAALMEISKIEISADASNSVANGLLGLLGFQQNGTKQISLKISACERTGFDKQKVKDALDKIEDAGLRHFVLRARHDNEDRMADYYLIGDGNYSSSITFKSTNEIPQKIVSSINENEILKEKIGDFKNECSDIEQNDNPFIGIYKSNNSRSAVVPDDLFG
jgi:hypothetical protein